MQTFAFKACNLLVAAAMLSGVLNAKESVVDSVWADGPITMDGVIGEWDGQPLTHEKKVKVDVAFKNDDKYLFVLFRFNDLRYLSSIDVTGMTLWLDPSGKKKKRCGIQFTKKKVSAEEYIALLEKRQGPLSEARKEEIRKSTVYFLSEATLRAGKKERGQKTGEPDPSAGAAYNARMGENAMVFEFRVPLYRMAEAMLGSEISPGTQLKIGFEWGGLTAEMRREYLKSRASGKGSGAIGIQEGGRGGGGASSAGFSGASPSDLSALRKMTKSYSFWKDVRLAGER